MSDVVYKNTIQTVVDIFKDVCDSDDPLETVLQRQGFSFSSESALRSNYTNSKNILFYIDTFPINNRSGVNILNRSVESIDMLLNVMELYSKYNGDYLNCLAYLVSLLGPPVDGHGELKQLSDRKHMYVPSSVWTIGDKSLRLDGIYCRGIENGVAVSAFMKYNGEIQWF